MIKQLLTALLIAGLSATAKAEPVVYYCEWVSGSEIWIDGRVNTFEGNRFTLAIDHNNKKITVAKRLGEDVVKIEYTEIISINAESDTFTISLPYQILNFTDMVVTHSKVIPGVFVVSQVGKCEDF